MRKCESAATLDADWRRKPLSKREFDGQIWKPMHNLIGYTKWLVKWIAILGLGLILLASAVTGGVYGWNWWSHGRHVEIIKVGGEWIGDRETKIRVSDKAEITATCTTDYPVLVWYENRSTRVVEYLNLNTSAFLPSRSTDIMDWSSTFTSDWILLAGEIQAQCMFFAVKREFAINVARFRK